MTEEQMKEYVVNGGKLFTIKTIDCENHFWRFFEQIT